MRGDMAGETVKRQSRETQTPQIPQRKHLLCVLCVPASLNLGSRGTQQQPFVQTSRPVSLQIEADVAVSRDLELADDRGANLGIERTRHLFTRELDPRDRVVMSDAEHPEPERAQRLLGAFDGAQLLVGHLGMIRNPRRQTGRGGLVPGRQPGAVRQLADFRLGEIDFVERAPDAELARRLSAGAVVAAIVGIVAVDDDRSDRSERLAKGRFLLDHSSQSSSSSVSSSSSPSSSPRSSSSRSSSSSSSSSSGARSSSSGDRLTTSRFEPHSGQLSWSPLSTSNSSTSISASHSGHVAIDLLDDLRKTSDYSDTLRRSVNFAVTRAASRSDTL